MKEVSIAIPTNNSFFRADSYWTTFSRWGSVILFAIRHTKTIDYPRPSNSQDVSPTSLSRDEGIVHSITFQPAHTAFFKAICLLLL